MPLKSARPRLSLLLLSLLGPFLAAPVHAADPSLSLQPDGSVSYTGDTARISLGYAKGGYFEGELTGVLKEQADSAWLGEAWLARSAGGLKLSYHRAMGDSVHKYFIAHDQNQTRDRKLTLGYGLEKENWFGNVNLSRGLTGRRLVDQRNTTTTTYESGVADAGAYVDTVTRLNSTRIYERAYDYGIGIRAGHYFSGSNVRLTTGYDFEWGRSHARQNTLSLTAEKIFVGTPHSVAVQLSHSHKSGDADIGRNDTRVMLAYRYSFGGPNTHPSSLSRKASFTQQQQDTPASTAAANLAAPAAAPATPAPEQFEKRWVKTKANMTSDAFFEFGSAKLTPLARTELDRVAQVLQSHGREGNVRIIGHTCDIGSDTVNDKLSLKRAQAVHNYLISVNAFPADVALVEGKGEREPKYPAEPATRHKNRRVELEFFSFVDKEELVKITPAEPVPAQDPASPAPQLPEAVMYEREIIDQPPAWVRQALRSPALHKRTVDVYRSVEETQTESRTRQWVNGTPLAKDDAYTVAAGSTIPLPVLSNDTDPDSGDTLTLVSVTPATHGQVRIDGQNLLYTAAPNTMGQDRFSYTLKDNKGLVASANVVVTITQQSNRAPLAVADRFVVSGKQSTTLRVMANDSDPDGDPLHIVSVTQPLGRTGSVQITGSEIIFTPTTPFWVDTFTYTISDGKGGLATATVELVDP